MSRMDIIGVLRNLTKLTAESNWEVPCRTPCGRVMCYRTPRSTPFIAMNVFVTGLGMCCGCSEAKIVVGTGAAMPRPYSSTECSSDKINRPSEPC